MLDEFTDCVIDPNGPLDKLIVGMVDGRADSIDEGFMEAIDKLAGLVDRFKLVEIVVLEVDVEDVGAVEMFCKLLTSGVGVWVFGCLGVLCVRVFKLSSYQVLGVCFFKLSSYQVIKVIALEIF